MKLYRNHYSDQIICVLKAVIFNQVLAIIAGFLLLCCNCGGNEESDDYPYNYGHAAAAPTKRANTEYV